MAGMGGAGSLILGWGLGSLHAGHVHKRANFRAWRYSTWNRGQAFGWCRGFAWLLGCWRDLLLPLIWPISS
ncbi:hypothetical protein QBC39DRAFT_337693 [Podospora conica]|nr:hypothetical protein QBC39DRAFT_337693 [Schizothecium conicum]